MRQHDLILGVDGGGTKTVAWIAIRNQDGQTNIVGRGRSGSSNCRSVSFAAATTNLGCAIDAALANANATMPIGVACLSLAGADRPTEQQQFRSWADARQLADQVIITNDAIPVLYAASSTGVGIALISGTGSMAIGRNADGQTLRCGGWGSLMGDEGSGYQIALAGLQAAVRAADGRGPQTTLLAQTLRHFQIDEASELVSTIYSPETDRSTIAQLAPIVFAASDDGDAVSMSIISKATTELSEMISTLASRLEFATRPISLAVSGGVLLNQPKLIDDIRQQLSNNGMEVEVTRVEDPVAGAINLAIQHSAGS